MYLIDFYCLLVRDLSNNRTSYHLSPVTCHALTVDAKKEFVKYEKALSSYYQSTRRSYLLFERNIRTSVREHMQTHLVPLTETQSDKCVQAFLNAANRHNLPFTEIQVPIYQSLVH